MRPAACAAIAAFVLSAGAPPCARAQVVISDTLNGRVTPYQWQAFDGACLTAGRGEPSTIPACVATGGYYAARGSALTGGVAGRLGAAALPAVPDPDGRGALRLTNGEVGETWNSVNQRGAVVSNFTFPSSGGLQVVFSTVTYGGNGFTGSSASSPDGTGADGMSFFLMDGAQRPGVGSQGGGLGYACSNSNALPDGLAGGYLGIGIDEYGNFANPVNITDTGPGFSPGLISVRGAGNVNWAALRAAYPGMYPASLTDAQQKDAVRRTCRTAKVWNFSNPMAPAMTAQAVPWNYRLLTSGYLPAGVRISSQQLSALPLRSKATPLTFQVILGQDGIANVNYRISGGAPQALLSNFNIRQNNAPLPARLRFGFAASTGGGTNVHEITCFRASDGRRSTGTAGSGNPQGSRVSAGSQVFVASYDEVNWWGDLQAFELRTTAGGLIEAAPTATWSASCRLAGGPCTATAGVGTAAPMAPDSRVLLTWDAGAGVPLRWERLSPAAQAALDGPVARSGQAMLAYMRGGRSGEIAAGGSLRTRTGLLGDVIGSSPAWVGPPQARYPDLWTDLLRPDAVNPETGYGAFAASLGNRPNVAYVGANDGMLHGFSAGAGRVEPDGSFTLTDAASNSGQELLGFMPRQALATLRSVTPALDYASPRYGHKPFVDATPGKGDLFYGGAWHTWLVGGLGYGGNPGGAFNRETDIGLGSLYVLDVTDPRRFSEANAASLVRANLDTDTLRCVNDAACGASFGSQTGTPVVARLHNGRWAVLAGNGLNSSSGKAGLFIGHVDPATGALEMRFLDTGAGPVLSGTTVTARNGIAFVTPADLDGDRITDYVYAGDVRGNVWRFDLTSATPAEWSAMRIFATPPGRPVSTRLVVAAAPQGSSGGPPRLMLAFGTGRAWPQTLSAAAAYAQGTQSVYGIWDWRMEAWNARAPGNAYASLASDAGATEALQSLGSPQPGSPASQGLSYQALSRNTVCWYGSSACASGNTATRWRLDLVNEREQLVYSPTLFDGLLLLNTIIPVHVDAVACDFLRPSGFTLALDIATGGLPSLPPFGDGSELIGGLGLAGTGTPLVLSSGSQFTLLTNTGTATVKTTPLRVTRASRGERLNWLKVR